MEERRRTPGETCWSSSYGGERDEIALFIDPDCLDFV